MTEEITADDFEIDEPDFYKTGGLKFSIMTNDPEGDRDRILQGLKLLELIKKEYEVNERVTLVNLPIEVQTARAYTFGVIMDLLEKSKK